MPEAYDFIIVGAGASGCLLANRLASTSSSPSVLLLEAGRSNDTPAIRSPFARFTNFMDPSLGWTGYSHVQRNVGNSRLPYPRGKGLGGTTVINAMVYHIGSSDEYDSWADHTGCELWRWEKTRERFRKFETFHDDTPVEFRRYFHAVPESHGSTGPIDISVPSVWEPGVEKVMEIFNRDARDPMNLDQNTGNPIGWGLSPLTGHNGSRVTAASACLHSPPSNLVIWTNSEVQRVIFEKTTAVGVEMVDGRKAYASKAVILSAGAINSPKVLLLSGVGPESDLVRLGINVISLCEGIGKNLQDQVYCMIETRLSQKLLDRDTADAMNELPETIKQLSHADSTTAVNPLWSCIPFGYLKTPATLETTEFQQLDQSTRELLQKSTVPHMAASAAAPLLPVGRKSDAPFFHNYAVYLMNPQSRGSVRLQSANPSDPPVFGFNSFSHPYDLRSQINNIRKLMEFVEGEANSKYFDGYINAPASKSDADIETWLRTQSGLFFHATGSVMMGKKGATHACVDSDFHVFGTERLYVVDLSVCPTTPSCPTQSTAYLVAETAAEVLEKLTKVNV